MTDQKEMILSTVPEKEADLIKSVFKENVDLLKIMRNLFFGFDLTSGEKKLIKETFASPLLRDAVRKKMYPKLSDTRDLPIGVAADFWLDVEKDILGAHSSAIYQKISSKERCHAMLEIALALLENPEGSKVDLDYKQNLVSDEWQVGLLARSLYIRTVGQGLTILKMIADQVSESEAQKKKRLLQNSTK